MNKNAVVLSPGCIEPVVLSGAAVRRSGVSDWETGARAGAFSSTFEEQLYFMDLTHLLKSLYTPFDGKHF